MRPRFGWCLLGLALALLAGSASSAGAVDKGALAPAFALPELGSRQTLALQSLQGKVVLLDFWASWCAPCLKSLPLYEKLRHEFPRADFEIVAVNLDEVEADATAFLATHKVSYPSLRDAEGGVAKSYGLVGMPSSYLIDRAGRVQGRHVGFKVSDIVRLRAEIKQLIGAADAP